MTIVKRILVVDRPSIAPAHCIVCGSTGSDRKYINFDFYIDYYGAVYFCIPCFSEIAAEVGYGSPKALANLKTELQNLQTDRVGDRREINRLLVRIEALNEVLRGVVSDSSNNDTLRDISDSADVSQPSDGDSTETVSKGTVSDGDSGDKGSKRSSSRSSNRKSSSTVATAPEAIKF